MRYLLVMFAIFFVSCSVKVINKEQYVIALKDNPVEYHEEDGRIPYDRLTTLEILTGDTLFSPAYAEPTHWDSWIKYVIYYEVDYNGKLLKVSPDDFATSDNFKYMMQSPTFRIPVEYDQTAWGRAINYIQTYSDMKIQISSDNLIETYNPTEFYKIGYSVNKVKYSDYVEYSVKAVKYNGNCSTCLEARKFAHYINDFEKK